MVYTIRQVHAVFECIFLQMQYHHCVMAWDRGCILAHNYLHHFKVLGGNTYPLGLIQQEIQKKMHFIMRMSKAFDC